MPFRIFSIVSILILIIYIGVSFFIANNLTQSSPSTILISKDAVSKNSENIFFKAPDGIGLSGWFFKENSDKLIIMVEGFKGDRTDPYYHALEIIKFLLANKYNVIAYDTRGDGESQLVRPSFGLREGRDILGAINFAKSRGFREKNIGILSESLGAIETIMIFDKIPKIRAVVLDSPADVVEPIITKELINTYHVPYFLIPGVYFSAKYFLGIDIKKVRPIDKMKFKKNTPLLFLHGSKDTFILPIDSERLFKLSNSKSQRIIFKGAVHVKTYESNPNLYKTSVLNYFKEAFK